MSRLSVPVTGRSLGLRRIDPLCYAQQRAIKRWQCAGYQAELSSPVAPGDYLGFCAEGRGGGWQGLVEAREWLDGIFPQLRSLLRKPCSLGLVAELFQTVPQPLCITLDELRYERLSAVALVTAPVLESRPLPRIATEQGALWVVRLPDEVPPAQTLLSSPWLSSLPQCVRAILGYSELSGAALRTLAVGDVLRISRPAWQWHLAGQPVGEFTFIEEGLYMTLSPAEPDTPPEHGFDPGPALGRLPVCLEFILSEQRISLAELAALIEGQVLALDPAVLGDIEVRANGRAVARGELVHLGEDLGVELRQVGQGGRDEQ
ncbi:FliM/FliN family flagellar motor switch protein [Pseudomonas gingeri]|uniref:FliM/FliN family flagellar motor switch protein n=1 Tax=Pseudomonas gingeri TaxID=117681 RepID=UPI00159FB4C7|nr:FliM/FliN family flagellar motor switch protein [Pseudomonas gingeri]NVZ99856.1 FliM/FliN family flagellar motor switch protein [Pseudomonas gingeri]NWA16696.1 FliM/FliN family flagellar motor switch protein [Pseudomonas gingeri]NWA53918.1 FliM/FliN family flagellar motor switch protein [Pseudomonas gingeri]NWA94150.1 FliM/FliN family flagellar motor switch protein [Pseudomonas gingeri]NWB01950.1 FliM/FliN family flagellar motor switch protein [Pseudomonas gingeri]